LRKFSRRVTVNERPGKAHALSESILAAGEFKVFDALLVRLCDYRCCGVLFATVARERSVAVWRKELVQVINAVVIAVRYFTRWC
jgi:hypothetical protein